jgi:hypothetical protein
MPVVWQRKHSVRMDSELIRFQARVRCIFTERVVFTRRLGPTLCIGPGSVAGTVVGPGELVPPELLNRPIYYRPTPSRTCAISSY